MFFYFIGLMYGSGDEYSKIPVVLIDEDNSEFSKRIIGNIEENNLIKSIKVSKKEGFDLLDDDMIEGIYIFKKGLEDNILEEKIEGIIGAYYLEDSFIAPAITDLIAAEVLPILGEIKAANKLVAIYKSQDINNYEKAFDKSLRYSEKLKEKEKFRLPISIKTISSDNRIKRNIKIENSILTKKFALGMGLIFTSVYLLFCSTTIIRERRTSVYSRLKIIGYTRFQLTVANLLGIMVVGVFLFVIQFLIMVRYFSVEGISDILTIMLIYIIFTFTISNLVLLFTNIFKSQTILQTFSPLFITVMGLLSGCFFSIDIFPEKIQAIAKVIPMYWTLDSLTKMTIYSRGFNSILGSLIAVFIMGTIIFGVNYMVTNIKTLE